MKREHIEFQSEDYDQLFTRWLANNLHRGERAEWVRILASDPRFREDFCDWVKSLRDPGRPTSASSSLKERT